MFTLEQLAPQAKREAAKYRVCIALTSGDPEDGYGYCPLDAFLILHGPMAKAGIVKIVDLIGTQYATEADKAGMMARFGGGT